MGASLGLWLEGMILFSNLAHNFVPYPSNQPTFFRYNVIVKGFNGQKITAGKAIGFILVCWIFAIVIESLPFVGWGKYGLGKNAVFHVV